MLEGNLACGLAWTWIQCNLGHTIKVKCSKCFLYCRNMMATLKFIITSFPVLKTSKYNGSLAKNHFIITGPISNHIFFKKYHAA